MILAFVIIRALAINNWPKTIFLLLWGTVLLRLLIPFSVPSSLSVFSLAENVREQEYSAPYTGLPAAVSDGAAQDGERSEAPPAADDRQASAFPVKTVVWLSGAVILGGIFVLAYLRCLFEFRASLPVENEFAENWIKKRGLKRPVTVRQSDRISSPMTYGILRPVVLMPKNTDWKDEKQLEYILIHEFVHIRRFDIALKLLAAAAVCVHWFNPLVWLMYVLFNRDLELSCDERVVRELGMDSKAAYALMLIDMEEKKSGFMPFYSSLGMGPAEERITAIMKIKKTSLLTVFIAVLLIAGVTVAFATSAEEPSKEEQDKKLNDVYATESYETIMSYTDPTDSKTYYSTDGGKTFVPMTDEEFEASFPKVEWWTYEGYKAWLENEKTQLQSMLGEKGWTGGRGEFIWTQEIIDETIAMYEDILEQIKSGYLVSKTVDGSEDTMLMMGLEDRIFGSGEFFAGNEVPPIDEYEPFGMTLNESENALYYKGEKVLWFEDSVDMDDGAECSRCNYYREDGTVSLRTVRRSEPNPDGSVNLFGPILRMEVMTAQEAEKRIEAYLSFNLSAESTYVLSEFKDEVEAGAEDTAAVLKPYEAFGLTHENVPSEIGSLRMYWKGKPVHSVNDSETGIWIANSMRGLYLGDEAIDLEAVYENGKLTGLRESKCTHTGESTITAFATGTGTDEGTTIPDMFEKYAPYGITYKETATADGMERNLYLNGKPVNHFSDTTPAGGVFTFSSSIQTKDGLTVRTTYENNKLSGVTIA